MSFIGSLPFGVINMTVANIAIKRGLQAGLLVGAGAAFVEFFQALVAIKFTHIFVENPTIEFTLNVVATIVFWALAIYYLFFEKPPDPNKTETKERQMPDFFIGMLVSSMNVLVFPYWILYSGYLMSNGWMKSEDIFLCIFALGVALGGMALFALYAKLGIYILEKGPRIMKFVNVTIGLIFLGFGVFQLLSFVF